MADNNQHNIDHLINYYIGLVELNNKFIKPSFCKDNYKYEDLVTRMLSIKQLLIKKTLNNINSLYKPTANLFNSNDHFTILEECIMFYRENPDLDYPINITESNTVVNNQSDTGNNDNEIKIQLSDIQESMNKLINDNQNSAIIKSSNDTLAALNTNYELMKADLNKYDNLITHHINQTSQIIVESIEKEHARFAQKIASDSNTIINGITEANVNELEKQTKLIQSSVKDLNDKTFYQSCYLFIWSILLLFACSTLSSTWTATKVLNNVRLIKIVETPPPKLNIHKKASN